MAITTLGAALIGGGLLGSAALSSSASKKAGKTVSDSTDRAAQLQNQQFERLLALQMPGYRRAEDAAGLYGTALGIPRMTGSGSAPQNYGAQPQGGSMMMTGGGSSSPAYSGRQGGTYAQMMDLVESGQLEGDPRVGLSGSYTNGQSGVPAPQQVSNSGQPVQGGQPDIAAQVMGTPGYQTQLDQGLKAIDRAAPLTGGMYSGRRMKAVNDYGQQTFGSYYNDWLNRVGGVAGQAPQIASSIGQAGQQNANAVGNLWMTGANARANGQLNSANAWTSAIGTGIGLYSGAKGWL